MSRTFHALSKLTQRIERLLQPALGAAPFWVKAEIQSGRERGGTFFCDLVETDATGRVVAQLPGRIWSQDLAGIRQRFYEAGLPLSLEEGALVGALIRVQYHPRYGLSLAVVDMDPAFALGELELRRREILERLRAEGLLERNADLPVPLLPNRIGLVTSRDSAAYRDFVQTLFASGYGFRVWLADAAVQGRDTERSVLSALEAVIRHAPELVVVVRGGGSKVDLASLDNEVLARRIAGLGVPVWTGVGHETDFGVLDHVAGLAFKTPTAVAEELVERFRVQEQRLEHAGQRLRTAWRTRLVQDREWLEDSATGLRQGTRKLLDLRASQLRAGAGLLSSRVGERLTRARRALQEQRSALRAAAVGSLADRRRELAERRVALRKDAHHRVHAARRTHGWLRGRFRQAPLLARLAREREALADRERVLHASDPATSLERGFALVRDAQGVLLRSVATVAPGDRIHTQLADGRLHGRVEAVEVSDEQAGAQLRGEGAAARGDPAPAGRLGDAHR